MVAASTRQNLILAGSTIVGLTALGAVAYMLIQDDRQTKHLRQIRTLQKQLSHSLQTVETNLQTILDQDVRLAQVRTKTLRQHPIYKGDPHVALPSLGLINEQDQKLFGGEEVKETEEELRRERSGELGFGQDPARVRQGYKKLDFLVQSINEQLLRLLESLDAISPRELTDLGDGFGGIPLANGPEVQAFEKIRKRKRNDIARIQKLMGQMDLLGGSFKDRLVAVEIYEKKAAEAEAEAKEKAAAAVAAALAAEAEVEIKAQKDQEQQEQEHKTNGHAVAPAVAALVQPNLSFAEIASHNIPQPEVLAHTEDLEKMKEGVSFADVVAAHKDEEPASEDKEEEITIEVKDEAVLAQTEDLELMKEGVLFSEVVSHAVEETQDQEEVKIAAVPTEESLAAEIAAAL
ncbi:hypothetical protein EC991_000253 [Linnemannia zychae]|nr:hypothetical protein EC991_000253 [Linnemannia zychae]